MTAQCSQDDGFDVSPPSEDGFDDWEKSVLDAACVWQKESSVVPSVSRCVGFSSSGTLRFISVMEKLLSKGMDPTVPDGESGIRPMDLLAERLVMENAVETKEALLSMMVSLVEGYMDNPSTESFDVAYARRTSPLSLLLFHGFEEEAKILVFSVGEDDDEFERDWNSKVILGLLSDGRYDLIANWGFHRDFAMEVVDSCLRTPSGFILDASAKACLDEEYSRFASGMESSLLMEKNGGGEQRRRVKSV